MHPCVAASRLLHAVSLSNGPTAVRGYTSSETQEKGKKATKKRENVFVTRPDVPSLGLQLLKTEYNVSTWKQRTPMSHRMLLKHIAGVDALFCMITDRIDAKAINIAGPQLKCIATYSVGTDHIDLQECSKLGIRVGHTTDVLTDAVAELAISLLLATSRRLFEANKEVYVGGWQDWAPDWMCGQGLKNSRVGLFGFGRIGQAIAARLVPFKPAKLTYTTRTERPAEAEKVCATHVGFDEMLRKSDFIIVCCELTPETKLIFNEETFRKMKKNAIFINSARGGVVDHPALYQALVRKRIMAAGLDVTTPEPLPLNNPLLQLNNVVILPHIGSAETETREEMCCMTALNIMAALKGEKMMAEVPL